MSATDCKGIKLVLQAGPSMATPATGCPSEAGTVEGALEGAISHLVMQHQSLLAGLVWPHRHTMLNRNSGRH